MEIIEFLATLNEILFSIILLTGKIDTSTL